MNDQKKPSNILHPVRGNNHACYFFQATFVGILGTVGLGGG